MPEDNSFNKWLFLLIKASFFFLLQPWTCFSLRKAFATCQTFQNKSIQQASAFLYTQHLHLFDVALVSIQDSLYFRYNNFHWNIVKCTCKLSWVLIFWILGVWIGKCTILFWITRRFDSAQRPSGFDSALHSRDFNSAQCPNNFDFAKWKYNLKINLIGLAKVFLNKPGNRML